MVYHAGLREEMQDFPAHPKIPGNETLQQSKNITTTRIGITKNPWKPDIGKVVNEWDYSYDHVYPESIGRKKRQPEFTLRLPQLHNFNPQDTNPGY